MPAIEPPYPEPLSDHPLLDAAAKIVEEQERLRCLAFRYQHPKTVAAFSRRLFRVRRLV